MNYIQNKVLKQKKSGAFKVKDGLVEVKNFSLSFGNKHKKIVAVNNTSIKINPGEFICLLGPSGCGKSSLLNGIAGFVKPSSGNIYVDGKEVFAPGADRGMVFQQYSLLPWKTVYENISLGPKLLGDFSQKETCEALLEMIGLNRYRNHYPSELSGGMQQRVGIARAIATYPKVLLMDEPFGALDSQTRLIMQENLLEIWSQFGITVIFVTHDVDEAVFLSDRILIMSAAPGKIIADIHNDFLRPRLQKMTTEKNFLDIKAECLSLIKDQSIKAFEQQNA
ncbi:MAG: ABC transporter ATP-binding protein [Candidatus Puniceispirillales bacterium]|jgi:NitT/TauT family transport system ATP-binding protein|tara:strand:+ start:2209 stop:3048 length:840 start_codon:yes stop_codon:yes gene_type:complete